MLTRTGIAAGALMLMSASAQAGKDDVILQLTGGVAGGAVEMDCEELQALPQVTLETSTVVTDGVHSFTGFLMRDLLEQVEAEGEQLIATALNDYVVEIPMTDFYNFDVIVAHRMDGQPLRRDGKGPLWIVYPRDDHEALQDIRYDYRWVWQLSRLEVQ